MKVITKLITSLSIFAIYTYGCYNLGLDFYNARITCNKINIINKDLN